MNSTREILEAVARGELSPEDAASQLSDTPAAVTKVRISGAFQTAKITGDADVATAIVDEGAHQVRVEGDTLIIDANPSPDGEGFQYRESSRGSRARIHIGIDSRPVPLKIRMHPSLALETEVAAGTITVSGVHGPIKAEVAAGACKLEDVRSPFDLMVATGAVKVIGRLSSGESKIRCETGGVKVLLDPSSSVKITARTGLGKVSLPDVKDPNPFGIGSASSESTIGAGEGTLHIDCSLGAVKVALSEDDE